MKTEIEHLIIKDSTTLKESLTKMDDVGFKLLMITDDNLRLRGLISIGDIQRAIIANKPMEDLAVNYVREDLLIAKEGEPFEKIKKQMLKYRLVYMPVINEDRKIKEVLFWEDIIKDSSAISYREINLPVVIMAGGFGTRLRPLTNVLPKPLLPYGDSTILEKIIQRFTKYNCRQFDISVNYKAELIQFYFDRLNIKDYEVNFIKEGKPLGTAGSLQLLKNKLNKTFFVSNCDILIDEDYAVIYDYHRSQNNELTIVASLKSYNIPYGTIDSGKDGQLVSINEKPQLDYLINTGMYILEPHLLEEIPKDRLFHITELIELIKSRKGRVGVFPVSEKSWIDIGQWDKYLATINFG